MTQGAPTTPADEAIDIGRLLRRAAIATVVVVLGTAVVVTAAVARAAPTHETASLLAAAVMGHATGPVVVDDEALQGLARFDIEVQRAEARIDEAASGLTGYHGGDGMTLPRLALAGLGARGASTIAAFADDVAVFLKSTRTSARPCCGAFKPVQCDVRARTAEPPLLPVETELFVECRDTSDNLLTFLVVDGAVVQVVSSTVGRTALAVAGPRSR